MTKPFNKWLQEMMDREDLNQTSLALRIGRSQSTVSTWIRGTAVPDMESSIKLASFFGVSKETVLVLAGHMLPRVSESPSRDWQFLPGTPQYELMRIISNMSTEEVEALLQVVRTFRRNSDS
jgi:transcriptional regulator with XRE-family HTH domain